jgi:FtsP/CotA-like multicopper oxidase with cupredoxin domain
MGGGVKMIQNLQINLNSINKDDFPNFNPSGIVSFDVHFLHNGVEHIAVVAKAMGTGNWHIHDVAFLIEDYYGHRKDGWEYYGNMNKTFEEIDELDNLINKDLKIQALIESLDVVLA